MKFAFRLVDEAARKFCEEVVKALVVYGFSPAEAAELLNQRWAHCVEVGGPGEVLFHDMPERWAERIHGQFLMGELSLGDRSPEK